ncbi:MAG: polysaccharide deacetylase family protein [Actinomycetota bacterium]|nr:polysaccharide deacetylase family protein [Actinomycetota bacterium]
MDDEQRSPRSAPVTRRGVLAAGVGLVATACGASARPAAPSPSPAKVAGARLAPSPPPPAAAVAAIADPGAALSRVPTLAVPVQSRPAYRLADLAPDAAASAVALTIDDGPDPRYTPEVLAVLAHYQVTATFSVIGRQAVRYPQLLVNILAQGHSLTNHSMNHVQPFARLPDARVQTEIVSGLEAIYDATGFATSTFRSPGGEWSPSIFAFVAELGMMPIDWDVDPRDWARPGVAAITTKLLRAQAGEILLCHDGGGNRSETVTALRTVVPSLKARGLTFVTL